MHPVKFLSRGRGGGLWWPAGLLFQKCVYNITIYRGGGEVNKWMVL